MELNPRQPDEGKAQSRPVGVSWSGRQNSGLGSCIHAHFAHLGGVDLDVTDRGELAADLERRARIAELFVSGDWGVELEAFEADQERERQQEAET